MSSPPGWAPPKTKLKLDCEVEPVPTLIVIRTSFEVNTEVLGTLNPQTPMLLLASLCNLCLSIAALVIAVLCFLTYITLYMSSFLCFFASTDPEGNPTVTPQETTKRFKMKGFHPGTSPIHIQHSKLNSGKHKLDSSAQYMFPCSLCILSV